MASLIVLEPALGRLVARVLVRMRLAGKLAEGLLDVGLRRGPRDAEGLVVVLELGLGHLQPQAGVTPRLSEETTTVG